MSESRKMARALLQQSLGRGDPLGWFEPLYAQANGAASAISWADQVVNPLLACWLAGRPASAGRALDVGGGLGDNAAALSAAGFTVTSVDISPTAVEWSRRRFPTLPIDWRVANLLELPADCCGAFDLVVEVYTLQVLPQRERRFAMESLMSAVAVDGTLLVICRGRDPIDPPGEMPWPLTLDELLYFESLGLMREGFEEIFDYESPPVRRFVVTYRKNR